MSKFKKLLEIIELDKEIKRLLKELKVVKSNIKKKNFIYLHQNKLRLAEKNFKTSLYP